MATTATPTGRPSARLEDESDALASYLDDDGVVYDMDAFNRSSTMHQGPPAITIMVVGIGKVPLKCLRPTFLLVTLYPDLQIGDDSTYDVVQGLEDGAAPRERTLA